VKDKTGRVMLPGSDEQRMSPQMMDAAQAASYLSISKDRLYRLSRSGVLPFTRTGRSLRFLVEDLDAYLAQQTSVTNHVLASSQELFVKVFDATPHPISINTLSDGRLLDVNNHLLRLTGYTREEIIGRTTQEINIYSNMEDRARIREILLKRGAIRDLEIKFRIKSGEVLVGVMSAEVIEFGGEKCVLTTVTDITERRRFEQRLAAQYAATRVLSESNTLEEAAPQLLQFVGETLGWNVGAIWQVDEAMGVVRCVETWHAPSVLVAEFEELSRKTTFRQGIGLPGRVWAEARPAWVADVVADANFPRAHVADQEGLHGAVGFPIIIKGHVLGVIEFFTSQIREPDEDMLRMMTTVGNEIGQFIERKRAEQALHETNQALQALIQASPVAIINLDPQGIVKLWNPAAERIYGWSEQEVINRPLPTVPSDREEDYRRDHENASRGFIFNGLETRRRRKDGALIDVSISTAPLRNARGEVTSVVALVTDITERKRAEEALRESEDRFRTVAETASDAIIMIDEASTIIFINAAAENIFGYTVEEMRGEHLTMLMPEYLRHIHRQSLDRYVRTGEKHTSWRAVELPGLHKSGQEIPLELSFGEFIREGRHFFTGIARDINERKQLEQAIRLRAEELAEANRIKDEFLATLSHEMRTPLTSILGWAHLLEAGNLNEETSTRALEAIQRNAKSQAQLIEDLLDVSRVITGKLRLEVRPINLASVIEAAVDAVRPAAEAKGVELTMRLDHAVIVSADPDRLQQVIWNLLSNSIKFTGVQGRIEIEFERAQAHARVVVRDTGIGISPDFLPHVFDRFRQADSTSTRHYGGLGLGLALVRHLVEMHGGTVEAASPGEGMGATFVVTLPVVAAVATTARRAPALRLTDDPSLENYYGSELKDLCVLIVDDEEDARDLLKTVLVQCGAEVRAAGSTAQALALIARERPDVMVCDIGMPGEDGYALISRVRALPPEQGGETPAVALTAYAREEDRVRALAAGFQVHLSKPIQPSKLVAVVASVAGRTHVD
jgi:PAS domain S-box-containing protein/excisionase family DNA binding protein